jgi:tRNA(fMet)-specific endonuclease VapC
MAGWLIDTSLLVDAERDQSALGRIPADEPHAISVISVSELLHGVHRAPDGARSTQRHAFVEGVLAGALPILPVTAEVARIHAGLWARLDAAGEPVPAHDLWIAATALAHGMSVATSNARDFARVPGLRLLPA